jgi:VWFA-related protein
VVFPCRRDSSRALVVLTRTLVPWVSMVLLATLGASGQAPDAGALSLGASGVPGLEVPLVQLDVRVTGTRGEPVLDLERDDFVLFQDDRPVPVAGFSAPSADRPGASSNEEAPLHLVLYFHLQFLEPGDLAGLPEALETFLRDDLPPDARVLLAVANPDLRILQGFTTDRQLILDRLDEIVEHGGTSRLAAEYGSVLREIREQVRKPVEEGRAEIREAIPRALLTRIGNVAEQAYRELKISAAALARLMTPLAGLPGRKEVLVLSGRLPARAGPALFDAWTRAFDRDSPYWGDGRTTGTSVQEIEFDSLPEGSAFFETARVFAALAEVAAARGVVLHTLDASSGRSRRSATSSPGAFGRDTRTAEGRDLGDRQALRMLAEGTGGRDLAASEIEDGLATLARDLRSRYVLVFAPPQGPDGATHEIRVRLPRHRRLEVHHRPVYRALSRDRRTAERLVSALLLSAPASAPARVLTSIAEPWLAGENPLGAEAEPVGADLSDTPDHGAESETDPNRGSREGDPGQTGGSVGNEPGVTQGAVQVAIRVPLANLALIPEGRIHRGQISVFSSSAKGGELAPVTKSVVPVLVDNEDLLTVQGRRIEYLLELSPGFDSHRLAVAVRDDFQELTSVLVLDPTHGEVSGTPRGEGTRAAVPAARELPETPGDGKGPRLGTGP